jgi:hypothetical protein
MVPRCLHKVLWIVSNATPDFSKLFILHFLCLGVRIGDVLEAEALAASDSAA